MDLEDQHVLSWYLSTKCFTEFLLSVAPPLPFRDYRITVFATCHAIRRNYSGPSSSSTSSSSSEFDRPYLCRPWQRLVTHRLLCSRELAGNNMAAAAASTENQRRQQVFTVLCTSSRTRAARSSSFCVMDGGVDFFH